MAYEPRKPKELALLLLRDEALKQKIYNLIAKHDREFKAGLQAALRDFMQRNDLDLGMMDDNLAARGLHMFYKKARFAGRYINLK